MVIFPATAHGNSCRHGKAIPAAFLNIRNESLCARDLSEFPVIGWIQ
jgi:hypothetical protein